MMLRQRDLPKIFSYQEKEYRDIHLPRLLLLSRVSQYIYAKNPEYTLAAEEPRHPFPQALVLLQMELLRPRKPLLCQVALTRALVLVCLRNCVLAPYRIVKLRLGILTNINTLKNSYFFFARKETP